MQNKKNYQLIRPLFDHFSTTFRPHNLKIIKKRTITSSNNYQYGALMVEIQQPLIINL